MREYIRIIREFIESRIALCEAYGDTKSATTLRELFAGQISEERIAKYRKQFEKCK